MYALSLVHEDTPEFLKVATQSSWTGLPTPLVKRVDDRTMPVVNIGYDAQLYDAYLVKKGQSTTMPASIVAEVGEGGYERYLLRFNGEYRNGVTVG